MAFKQRFFLAMIFEGLLSYTVSTFACLSFVHQFLNSNFCKCSSKDMHEAKKLKM